MARVLFADDNPGLRGIFQTLLAHAGHEAVIAATPAEVLAVLKDVDLVIADLRFPDAQDGLALIRDIRKSGCATPILLLSGAPEDIEGHPEEKMVTRLIEKPPRVPELLAAIDELTR